MGEITPCWSCGYDMRGSPTTRCSECGARTVDRPTPWRPSKHVVGWSAAAVSISASLLAPVWTFQNADMCLRELHSGCGTVRLAAKLTLVFAVPMLECVAVLGWGVTQKAHAAIAPARCASLASVAAWLVANAIIAFVK